MEMKKDNRTEFEKMEAGASIVQLYTGFIYKGPELIADCSEAIAQWRDQKGR